MRARDVLGFVVLVLGLGCDPPADRDSPSDAAGGNGSAGSTSQPADASGSAGRSGEAESGSAPDDAPGEEGMPPLPPGPYENSLGMRFVPVAGTSVLFSVWETRVRDYEAYATATQTAVPHPDFPEEPLQPKAAISRAQALAFAAWLTSVEQKEGKIRPVQSYRLPTDAEWDVAFEVGQTGGPYPWGDGFPPPDHFANYEITNDGFVYTAPVGSFASNRLGLYDLAGNLWEWIGEGCASGGAYVVRGAGWNAHTAAYFELGFHYCFSDDLVGHHNVGFRVVIDGAF